MRPEYLGMLTVAILWGTYPLVTRSAGVVTAIGTAIMMSTGLIVIGIAAIWQGVATRPTAIEAGKLAIAGAMMGAGLLAFNAVASSRRMDASISIPIMDTAMLLVTVVAAVAFFGEPITVKKVIGLALLLAGIAVLH